MSSLPIIIIGAGGHGRVLCETLRRAGRTVIAFTDSDVAVHGKTVNSLPVLGSDQCIFDRNPSEVELVNGIGSISTLGPRRRVYDQFKSKNYQFASVIDPSATIGNYVSIEEGAQVMAGAIVQSGCTIGANSIVNTGAVIDHDSKIGSHTHVSPGSTLCGSVFIGEEVHVGAGSTVIQNISIGRGSVIAAGAVIVADVPEACLALGVPGRVSKL